MDAPRQLEITNVVSKQCARWDCRQVPLIQGDYCRESCLEIATEFSKYTSPFSMTNIFSSTTEFAPIATKILKSNKESGVPHLHLSQDLFTIPPWQSGMFTSEFDPRQDYCEWVFLGTYQIPETSDFKWIGGRSRMIGEVRHCVFKPCPREDDKWTLHQYSSPDMMEKSVYVMHCNKEGKAIKPVKRKRN